MLLQSASKRIADWLVKGGQISDDAREVHEYGFEKLLASAVNFMFAFGFGLLLGIPLQALIFYVAYSLLRVYAGGYHADTQLRCFLISIGVMASCMYIIKNQHIWNLPVVFYGLLLLCCAILMFIAPVDSVNKVLDSLEKKVYRRRLLRNFTITTVGAVIFTVTSLYEYSSAVLCAIVLTTVMAIVGKAKYTFQIN